MKSRLCATLVLILLASGCATKGLHSEFDDVPVPRGLTYQTDQQATSQTADGTARGSAAAASSPERVANPTMAGVDPSAGAPGTRETPRSEPSFAQRVKDFFNNLFPR